MITKERFTEILTEEGIPAEDIEMLWNDRPSDEKLETVTEADFRRGAKAVLPLCLLHQAIKGRKPNEHTST